MAIAKKAARMLMVRLTNHNLLTLMANGGGSSGDSESNDTGSVVSRRCVEFAKPFKMEYDATREEISASVLSPAGKALTSLYDSTIKAVTTAEYKAAY